MSCGVVGLGFGMAGVDKKKCCDVFRAYVMLCELEGSIASYGRILLSASVGGKRNGMVWMGFSLDVRLFFEHPGNLSQHINEMKYTLHPKRILSCYHSLANQNVHSARLSFPPLCFYNSGYQMSTHIYGRDISKNHQLFLNYVDSSDTLVESFASFFFYPTARSTTLYVGWASTLNLSP